MIATRTAVSVAEVLLRAIRASEGLSSAGRMLTSCLSGLWAPAATNMTIDSTAALARVAALEEGARALARGCS